MSEKRIVVPAEMLEAFWAEFSGGPRGPESHRRTVDGLEAALRWLSENPIVPSEEEVREMVAFKFGIPSKDLSANMSAAGAHAVVEWQRRMFLVPEPEVLEPIKDLLVDPMPTASNPCAVMDAKILNERVIEAYRRGQKAGKS